MRLHRAFTYFLSGFLAGLVILATFYAVVKIQQKNADVVAVQTGEDNRDFVINPFSGLFVQTMSEMTYDDTPVTGGFLRVSPSGRFLLFDAVYRPQNEDDQFLQRYYLGDMMTGERKEILGQPLRDWLDDDVLLTVKDNELQLYDTFSPDSPLEIYKMNDIVYSAKPSPDREWLAINTSGGVVIADRQTGVQRKIINGGQNGAYAWYQDNTRILGFRELPQPPVEEGEPDLRQPLHELVVWNTLNGEYDRLPGLDAFPRDTINFVEWLVPDKVARVNTGWDDSSRDYVISVPNDKSEYLGQTYIRDGKEVTEYSYGTIYPLGDTSRFYEDVRQNQRLDRLSVITNSGTERNPVQVLRNTNYFGDIHKRLIFKSEFQERHNMHLVDLDTALYLRNGDMDNTVTEIVKLNLDTGKETVLHEVPNATYSLGVTTDGEDTYWIVPNGDKLMIRQIDHINLGQ